MKQNHKICVLIPARYSSTRFEGKPLAEIHGQPLIYYAYEAAIHTPGINAVYVATEDDRIRRSVEMFGGKTILTSNQHLTGTDRIVEAIQKIDSDIIVNVQGDEPLVTSSMIQELYAPLLMNQNLKVTNLISKIDTIADFVDANVVKCVLNQKKEIMCFTRSAIPYPKSRQAFIAYKQIGMYAFRREALVQFGKMEQTLLEKIEGVEMLRFLENGISIQAVETESKTISVDTLSDLMEARKALQFHV